MGSETQNTVRFRGKEEVNSKQKSGKDLKEAEIYTSHPEVSPDNEDFLFLEKKTSNIDTKPAQDISSVKGLGLVFIFTALSFFTRLYKISWSNKVVWDEAHFGKFGSYYITHFFYHDVHPPLGKMLVGLGGYISGSNGTFKFDSGHQYPTDLNYGFQRSFLAFFGIIMVPLAYGTARNMGMSRKAASLAAAMVLFDNALCVISRFILLDSMVLGFCSLAFYFVTGFHSSRDKPFTLKWFFWLFGTGVSLGLASSVKWIGFFAVALVGVYTIEDLYGKFGDKKMTVTTYLGHWIVRIIGLIAIPIVIYMASFYVHFKLLSGTGDGDANMPSLFQSNLKGSSIGSGPIEVAFGSKVTIKNYSFGGALLHSHVQTYPEGSKQHQVTTYSHSDSNNDWVFLRDHTLSKLRKEKKELLQSETDEAVSKVNTSEKIEKEIKPEENSENVKNDSNAKKLVRRNNDFEEPASAEEAPLPEVPEEPKKGNEKEKENEVSGSAESKEGNQASKETFENPQEKDEGSKQADSEEKDKEKEKGENNEVKEEAEASGYVNDYLDQDEDLSEEVRLIRHGDILRLNHIGTKANLHSHTIPAPITTKDYEVSGYGYRDSGDSNDHWVVEIYDDLVGKKDGILRILSTRFKLRHNSTGCYLAYSGEKLPDWGFSQGEVTCKLNPSSRDNILWNIEAHWNKRLQEPVDEANKLKSNFFKDFIHLNVAMWRTNNALTPDEDKHDELTSQPYHWPLMLKGIRMCGWGDDDIKFYMLGNPIVWWSSTLSLLVIAVLNLFYIIRFKRRFREWYKDEWEQFTYVSKMILLGWFFQYIPYYIMGRVMYVHHYFPALYFAIFALPFVLDHITRRSSPQVQLITFSVVTIAIAIVFVYFSPMTFGMDFPSSQFKERNWLPTWKLSN